MKTDFINGYVKALIFLKGVEESRRNFQFLKSRKPDPTKKFMRTGRGKKK